MRPKGRLPGFRPYVQLFIVSYSFITVACPAFSGEASYVDRVLTLDDTVRIAQTQSETVLSSREDVTIALQHVHEAESLLFPELDLNANWNKFRVEGDRPFLTQTQLGQTLIPANARQNYYTTRVDIYQPIYEGGRLRTTWKQARIAYEKARDTEEGLQAQVAGAAKQAFYDLLLAQARHEIFATALKKSDSYQPSGHMPFVDRLRAQRNRSQLHELSAQAALQENAARLFYLRTLNLELTTNVQLSGELKASAVKIDLQKMLAWASRYRSELRQTEYQQESDALGISLSLAERTPSIGLGATYERSGNDISLPVFNWAGTLNVHLPVSISDMFFGWSKVRERRAQYRQATVKHADATDQVEKQVRDAYLGYCYWQDEMDPRTEDVKQMETLVKEADDLQIGAADRLELVRMSADAEVHRLEAIHGQLWSRAALERAVGHPLDEK